MYYLTLKDWILRNGYVTAPKDFISNNLVEGYLIVMTPNQFYSFIDPLFSVVSDASIIDLFDEMVDKNMAITYLYFNDDYKSIIDTMELEQTHEHHFKDTQNYYFCMVTSKNEQQN